MQPSRELRILAALYGFNGFFCLAFGALFFWALANHRSLMPIDIPFTGAIVGYIILEYLGLAVFGLLVSYAFFRIGYGILRGRGWAGTYGLVLSVVATAVMFLMLKSIYGVIV